MYMYILDDSDGFQGLNILVAIYKARHSPKM